LISDVNLLGNGQGIDYLDAQIPNGTLDLPVTQKQLHGSQIARAAVDQRRFGSAKRVCAEDVWIEANASDPFRHEPSILSGGHAPVRTSPTAEHELAVPLGGGLR
jgi:hypothetical protein